MAGCVGAAVTPLAAQLRPEIETFIGEMVERHGFRQVELERIFGAAQFHPAIINAISRPATSRPWYEYRPVFINPRRIAGGVAFWNSHAATLERARKEFGVPEEIIAAVIGVETYYGTQNGKHRVLDALTTLAFDYPKRAGFFRDQLEQYLLLGREQGADVLNIRGSYAGAIGIPQFMPGSYRRYAVDFDGDGKIDLSGSTADAIGSVANYLKSFGWETGQPVAIPALVSGENYREVLYSGTKPLHTVEEMRKLGIRSRADAPGDRPATLVELVTNGGNEYWLGFNNFFVITRYNRSVHYAMSVLQLAEEIRAARDVNSR
ncbi:MAG: lytic murein transglycosylase B [Nitrosospira sp.]|nr:lytic murein transglycosylase B [Nitrosospira sp.]MDN5881332.1 lytic murein transglycosylase B [Nitrosospira sp.]MDN5935742.1 lytic murein transglycosylase B [Nitrosospira sp.]